jgi:hypothetical protein
VMGRICPLQNAQPRGAQFAANILTSPRYGLAIKIP